jgi:hypothetical protein
MKDTSKMLSQLYLEHKNDIPTSFRWIDEKERLYELYYCLLLRISNKKEIEIRNIVEALSSLDLFDIESLAQSSSMGGQNKKGDKICSTITDLLIINGFKEDTARSCVLGICELAKYLNSEYDGKVQKFLRKHGNLMVEDFEKHISLSSLSKTEKRYVIVHWLQNIMDMPIPLSNEYVQKFCDQEQIKIDDIIEAADKDDVNVAYADDLITAHMLTSSKK